MDVSPSKNKKGCTGCLLAFVAVLLFVIALLTFNAFAPYFQEQRPVNVTITDEARQPVAGATIHLQEFEWVHYIPPLSFASPSRLIDRRRSVTTDADGKAQFTVQLRQAQTNRISRGDQILRVLSYQTTDSFRGRREPFHLPSRSDYGIEWGAIGGVNKLSYETSIVVSTAPTK